VAETSLVLSLTVVSEEKGDYKSPSSSSLSFVGLPFSNRELHNIREAFLKDVNLPFCRAVSIASQRTSLVMHPVLHQPHVGYSSTFQYLSLSHQ